MALQKGVFRFPLRYKFTYQKKRIHTWSLIMKAVMRLRAISAYENSQLVYVWRVRGGENSHVQVSVSLKG